MQQNFTRAARRALRAQSKAAAPLLARTFFDRDPTTGKATLVTDPRAVHVLERVCRRMMAEGGEVQVMEVARATAAAFPQTDLSSVPPDARHFVAVGLDPDTRAAFVVRSVMVSDCPTPAAARRAIEDAMIDALTPLISRSGWEGCA